MTSPKVQEAVDQLVGDHDQTSGDADHTSVAQTPQEQDHVAQEEEPIPALPLPSQV